MSSFSHSASKCSRSSVGPVVRSSAAASQFSSDKLKKAAARARTSSADDATIYQVKKKLKKLEDYKECQDIELTDKAVHLTQKEKLMEDFKHLLKNGVDGVLSQPDNDESDLVSPEEVRMQQERHRYEFRQAANLPIVLYLFSLNKNTGAPNVSSMLGNGAWLIGSDYGAMHAAIMVGDVYLEWGQESLVIPSEMSPGNALEKSRLKFFADIRAHSQYHADVETVEQSINTTVEKVEHTITTAQAKHEAISKLMDIICRYNSAYYYNVVCRNCQTFVADALKALGIDKPQLTGPLAEHIEQLKQGNLSVPKSFPKHEDVDAYVMKKKSKGELEDLSTDDLQSLFIAYHQHHNGVPECDIPTCKFKTISVLVSERLQVAAK